MSITKETAAMHSADPAITCCRFEAGTLIEPSILEDPAIFEDLKESGLLEIGDNCLTIGEVLGGKLTKTLDALTPITKDVVESLPQKTEEVVKYSDEEEEVLDLPEKSSVTQNSINSDYVTVRIGEGKNIEFSFPVTGVINQTGGATSPALSDIGANETLVENNSETDSKEKVLRSLQRKYFKITEVKRGPETKLEGTVLTIREGIEEDAIKNEPLVKDLKLEIITSDMYSEYSETIMDVQPIACKEDGELGSGITRVLDGVIMMVTGTDEDGVQIGEFGSSEGELDKNIMWNRPGAPDKGDIFIKTQVTIQAKTNMERRGPLAAHRASDHITDEIRKVLKDVDNNLVVKEEEFKQTYKPGCKKILIVKEIMGQGAMHDNLILPIEPVGILGGKPNVDLGNLPVLLSPLEILDGAVHALTCIGPASKEMSRHYFREPLILEAMKDDEINVCGVLLVGSPQINAEKFYVSKRLGMTIEAINPDGVIITTEGFGNNHIDFALHHEQVGMRGIPLVGMSFCAVQGALVTGNKYMNAMVDNNKSKQGIENEILANNTLCEEDAIRALIMLKSVMSGEEIKAPERKWNNSVKINNIELIEKEIGKKIDLVDNEQVLEKSKKRREIYEIEE